ncbi:MAG: transposase [Gammaproteobacteria bacterium]
MRDRKHNTYSLDFKRQAVMLALHPEIQVKDVAEALDIHPFMLSRWKKEMREKKLTGKDAVTIPASDLREAQETIRRLERQLKRAQEENDILKKFERFVVEKEMSGSK